MIPDITFSWPSVIEFGPGKLGTLKQHLEGMRKVFFLCDPSVQGLVESVVRRLAKEEIEVRMSADVAPEPPLAVLKRLIVPTREFAPDAVVGVGGGSAMDLAKLLAVLWAGDQEAEDIIGIDKVRGRTSKLIAVPTTAGTGSEVTPIAVVTDTAEKLKNGVVSRYLVPDVAVVDPELAIGLPPSVTAATGMDAMTHCVEAYTNRYSHPIIDCIALEGIRCIAGSLETAVKSGQDLEARTAMALGSLCGGLCLGPVNTAAVHALAYPVGAMFNVPHGLANSVLLPYVMEFNCGACAEKYARIAETMGVPPSLPMSAKASAAADKVVSLSRAVGIPRSLQEIGVPEEAILEMAQAALKVTRLLRNNPREVKLEDAEDIYRRSYR